MQGALRGRVAPARRPPAIVPSLPCRRRAASSGMPPSAADPRAAVCPARRARHRAPHLRASAGLHRRRGGGAARQPAGRPLQEPVPEGQEGRVVARRGARGAAHRSEAPGRRARRAALLVRQRRAAVRGARGEARQRDAVRAGQRYRAPASRSCSTAACWSTTRSIITRWKTTARPRSRPRDLLRFHRGLRPPPADCRSRRPRRRSRRLTAHFVPSPASACHRAAPPPCFRMEFRGENRMANEPLIGGGAAAGAALVKDVIDGRISWPRSSTPRSISRSSSISGRRGAAPASSSGRSSKRSCAPPTARCAWSSSTSTRTPRSRSRCASSRSRRSMPSRTGVRSTALSAPCRKARSSSSSSASAAGAAARRRSRRRWRWPRRRRRAAITAPPRRSIRRSCSTSPATPRRSPGWRAR